MVGEVGFDVIVEENGFVGFGVAVIVEFDWLALLNVEEFDDADAVVGARSVGCADLEVVH